MNELREFRLIFKKPEVHKREVKEVIDTIEKDIMSRYNAKLAEIMRQNKVTGKPKKFTSIEPIPEND